MLLRPQGFRRLCLARDLLCDPWEPSPTVVEVARRVQLSPSHFTRQFEAVFGVTPHQFRIDARLDAAKRLLAAGQSVTEACMAVGFSSLGTFSALFSRRVGESPSAFRRRIRDRMSQEDALTPGCLTLMTRLPSSSQVPSDRSFREA